jgi:hypothetical protein
VTHAHMRPVVHLAFRFKLAFRMSRSNTVKRFKR